ncbi:MAG: hypothetical protein Q8M07_16380 [Prosthecobacter sp.]|nr:hypothetical protein [Prosthecobacter sp.]
MISLGRFLARTGMIAMLAAAGAWLAALLGFWEQGGRWALYWAGGGLLMIMAGMNLILRRSSGVLLPPTTPADRHERRPK